MPHSVASSPNARATGDMPGAAVADARGSDLNGDTEMSDDHAVSYADENKANIEVKLDELFPDDDEDDEFSSSAPMSSSAPVKEEPSSPVLEPVYAPPRVGQQSRQC